MWAALHLARISRDPRHLRGAGETIARWDDVVLS